MRFLQGFHDTNWLPGAQNRLPLKAVEYPVLTVVPGFVRYPPELAYPPVSHTDEPAVVLREAGREPDGVVCWRCGADVLARRAMAICCG